MKKYIYLCKQTTDNLKLSSMEESRIKTQNRIFIGFSSIDRYEVVESILYHLANYGIATWYDRHKMRIGDFFSENFNDGILGSKYAVVIISHNIAKATCFAKELDCIKKQFERQELVVFPLFYKIKHNEIPMQYNWLTNLVYKEFDDKSGTLLICNHIMSRILTDELKKYKYRTLSELSNRLSFNNDDKFLDKILQTYLNIDRDNYNARITILYCLYTHISIKYGIIPMVPQFYWRCYERLFSYTKLNLSFDQREILILELSTMILINKCFY